jgi:heat-inducible transcriptional repressor
MSDLNHRARKILAAVVQEYLATGDAVGSRTVTRRHGIDLSPATVRNVMSDLEEAGLLKQPHTSAGRVPTDQGLRFFVDSLLKVRSLSPKEREQLMSRYAIPTDDVDGALREASKVLAELSANTVVIVMPTPAKDVLEHLEFMRLPGGQLLAVIVTKSGQVQNKLLAGFDAITGEDLERMHNYLKHTLGGLTLDEVREKIEAELGHERMHYQALERRALELSQQALPKGDAGSVIIEGQARMVDALAQPGGDPAELEKLRALFRTLEDKRRLSDLLLRTAQAEGIQVFIGAESHIAELSDFAVVAATYGNPGDDLGVRPLGTLGVIGPTRMNYSKVITLVDFTAQLMSDVIGKR